MVKRRAKAAGIKTEVVIKMFRGTGITAYTRKRWAPGAREADGETTR